MHFSQLGFSQLGLKISPWMLHRACGAALLGLIAGGAWHLQAADEPATATGLRGIVQTSICDDLNDVIASLPATWRKWGDELAIELSKLYGPDNLDVAAQRKLLGSLRARIKTARTHLADPRYRAITTELLTLQGELRRHVDLAEAALDTLEAPANVREGRLSEVSAKLAVEARTVRDYLNSIANGEGWIRYLGVEKLADAGSNPVEQNVALLTSLLQKFRNAGQISNVKSREFLGRFSSLEHAAGRYLAVANAPQVQPNSTALRSALQSLLHALEEYDAQHGKVQAGAVRKAFDAVRAAAPDGGDRIALALRNNYFNYNMRVVANEDFLNRFVSQQRNENGEVVDCILGANVYGEQTTASQVSLDLKPSNRTARFDIVVQGHVNSNTSGTTDQATVYTIGNHDFTAAKEINFNGDRFWTQPARIDVQANNNTYDAETKFGWIPILGGVARRIALGRAEEMRGESEAIAASRVQDKALPKFDSEVDREFGINGTFNPKFQKNVAARLQELGVYPDAKSYSSSETQLLVATRLMATEELGADEPVASLYPAQGMTLMLHESLMNNSLDRMNLNGQTLTEDQLRDRFSERLSKLLNREVKFPEGKKGEGKGPAVMVFDQLDPIRFRVEKGLVKVILKAGFKQEDKEDIPPQIVTIPLKISIVGKNVVIEQGGVEVAPVAKPESPAKQIARAGVIKRKLETALPRREVDRTYTFDRHNHRVDAALTRYRAADGWLALTFE